MSQATNLDTNYNYTRAGTDRADPVVTFSSADNAWRTEIKSEREETFDVGYREDADLGAFLSRPIKIAEYTWTVGVPLNVEFDPWSLFLGNPNVVRRIENYFLLRGDLDLKIMINGNGFYYGRLLAAYNPLKDFRVFDAPVGDPLYNGQASQRPHLFVDPSTSTGGEMFLPYFYPKNWISLPTGEYNKLGTVSLTTLNNLNQSNSGSGFVNISVFVCMKNLKLTIPTVNPVGSISPQSGKLEDSIRESHDDKKKYRMLRNMWKWSKERWDFQEQQYWLDEYNEPVIPEGVPISHARHGEIYDEENQIHPEGGAEPEEAPTRFRSLQERDEWLQDQAIKKARKLSEDEQPRSRICGDPIAIVAAALAGLSAAGFAREINALRGRAKQLEKAISDADKLTEDIAKTCDQDTLLDGEFGDVPLTTSDIKPESGKGSGKKGGKGKGGGTISGSTQSKDEYGDGIISKPASVLAKMAGSITNVPVIGKYALASKYALEGVGNIARIFGYSRPPIIDNIMPTKIQGAGYSAYTDMDEVVAKLSLDTKQELSIDPTTVGIDGTDQMSLSHVLQKESFLTTFAWEEADSSETVLFNANVCPGYYQTTGSWGALTGKATVNPMTHVSQMFQNWRGSIVVRFQIVASQFHKGRIRITWDPYSTGIFDSTAYNIAYNRVIDLAEDRDFEMTFRWGQAEAWKRVPVIAGLQTSNVYSTGALLPLAERTNGMLQVSVLNALTTPNPLVAAPVGINVFVRAGDDFELANPTDGQMQTLTYNDVDNFPAGRRLTMIEDGKRIMADIKPESGMEDECNEKTDNGMSSELDNAPVVVDQLNAVGGEMIMPTDNSLHVFMGEKIASLRQLMKRYCVHDHLGWEPGSENLWMARWFILNFPVLRGYSFSARTNDGFDPYNYTHFTWMNYITPMYAGWRGGIRRKIQTVGLNTRSVMSVARDSDSIFGAGQTFSVEAMNGVDANDVAYKGVKQSENGRGGRYATDGVINPTIEYEVPFYSEYRFAHTQSFNNQNTLTRYPDGLHHAVELQSQGLSSATNAVAYSQVSVAVGEDFSCFWFLNVPTVYSYDNPPY